MLLSEQFKGGSMNWDNLYNKKQSLVPLLRDNKLNWELLIVREILKHHCVSGPVLNAGANVSRDADYLIRFAEQTDRSVHMCDALHWADDDTRSEFIEWAEAKFPQAQHHWSYAQTLAPEYAFIFNGLSNFSDISGWYLTFDHPCWMLRVSGAAQDMFNRVAQPLVDEQIFYVLRTSGFDLWVNDRSTRDQFIADVPRIATVLGDTAHLGVYRNFVSATSNSGSNQQLYASTNHEEFTSYFEIPYNF
jgi:hypothetical protein